eukprot:CAMPEP_0202865298 /NCGR_PEP_ID=MMETSP1391-20130828/5604_1 /ASSEMBLY_ACC=CAM_ASM_000867 /TAXON_ID=1034604 /ORGANISM="Chlamydomonas leiostraca, Strain SAG 11-49" /LENGTH=121 /DNA_ID=CAMNT_0049545121 /DNA_START=18 /DNA_END=383 /DNA_ORIENTATION=+
MQLASAKTGVCLASRRSRVARCTVMASTKASAKITVTRTPPEDKLKALGVRSWPTWGCGVSKFPWTYQETETAYLLEGEVTVTPNGGEPVEIRAGDLCVFPAGMSCTWDVRKPINKHYDFS